MANDQNTILTESIKRLLRRGATSHLTKIVNKAHVADLSLVFRSLTLGHQKKLFSMIEDIEQKGDLFSALETNVLLDFIENMRIDDIVEVMNNMASDDVADLLGKLPHKKADAILERMEVEDSEEVEGLLSYGNDTAGGIMIPDFIAMQEEMTCKAAIERIQKEYHDVEMPFYIYVVDENYKLLGVISLRQLVVEKPETQLRDFMATDIFSVRTDMDQEEVARIVARYDILAVPVIDENHKLVGIVTVDDVIDIIRLEATEDMLKMAGAGEVFIETQSVLRSTRIRLPWLFASAMGGVVAMFIIAHFQSSLQKVAYLAAFIPIIMGMGGNIGSQSATIVVRGLATGRLHLGDIWKIISKELTVGFILGNVYGTLVAGVAGFRFHELMNWGFFAFSVGLAVICSMSVAGLIGSLVPLIMARLNFDPAVATGPFVSTTIDITSVSFYFIIATTLLGI